VPPATSATRPLVFSPLPGAAPFDPSLVRKLREAVAAKGPKYRPRTRHLNPDGSAKYTNRLILESSPYLTQHAHNPVNWYPWGDEAFETARQLGRPVLLSVGYSTCHWCHVMEEESFEDEEIARAMNESYVAVKVDREERPDVDAVYMSALQTLTGGGGWPMNLWLTPDRKPFFGGTYFPARDGDRGSRSGFLTLLRRLRSTYDADGERVAETATRITQSIQKDLASPSGTDLPGPRVLHGAATYYRTHFDPEDGGVAGAPKFPGTLPIRFLLRYHRRTGDPESLRMATLTLEKMAAGGICDQVGGGFHRYATDGRWLVPHFEKMLYDNALLALTYLDGYQVTGRQEFARVTREILRYVERDMTSAEGAFYSATDADSLDPEGRREEGRFFTWTPEEIESVLGKDRARVVLALYDVSPQGNFDGRSILHVPRPVEAVAHDLGLSTEAVRSTRDESRDLLYAARSRRPAPLRDEKILTGWNGLMISAYARAALVLDDERYARKAEQAAGFILKRRGPDGRLPHDAARGAAGRVAFLSDYAFFTAGILDLFEATGDPRWLRDALGLDRVLQEHYEDRGKGGFFQTGDDQEKLLTREKPGYDGAEPSGNSLAVLNLLRLHEITTQERYLERAEKALKAFHGTLARTPTSLSEMLLAVDFRLDTPKEIVIVTPHSKADAAPFLARLRGLFLPNRILLVASEGKDLQELSKLTPLLEGKVAPKGRTTAYVCERHVCELPTADPEVFGRQIRRTAALPKSAVPG